MTGGQLRVRVAEAGDVAEGVRSFRLERPHRAPLPAWRPGAHIDVTLPGVGTRQYSLCGDPADETQYVIAVLRTPDSRGGSEYLHEHVAEGHLLTIGEPRNNFRFEPGEACLFIAGGVGITPILPMVQQAEREGRQWRLAYGGRSLRSMAFLPKLRQYGDRVSIVPEDRQGRLDLDTILADPRADTDVYCCGPGALLDTVQRVSASRWAPGRLHLERFAAQTPQSQSGGAFQVAADRSGAEVTVGPGESIVDVLAAAGVVVPTSCREGLCGTCETPVLDGVPDHRDEILSDADKASGKTIVLCVSRCLGDRLVLDL